MLREVGEGRLLGRERAKGLWMSKHDKWLRAGLIIEG